MADENTPAAASSSADAADKSETPRRKPLPGTNVSPGMYHLDLLKTVMPDEQVRPIIEFARRHPVVPLRPPQQGANQEKIGADLKPGADPETKKL